MARATPALETRSCSPSERATAELWPSRAADSLLLVASAESVLGRTGEPLLAQLRQVEDAYKESERVKDDLIHMLVHDLKSPISSVMGLLDHSLEVMRNSA